MFSEDELWPLSALQHLLFCERQCALIHIEQLWEENRLTAEGRVLHERVHENGIESRRDVRIARGIRLRSLRLGLVGQADVVEFHRCGDIWVPFPVEYKRGKQKTGDIDTVQVCAQALCLEEMLGMSVPAGALFYGTTRRRVEVVFDQSLRDKTTVAANRLHQLIDQGLTPPAIYTKKCDRCSLFSLCLPKSAGQNKSAIAYLNRIVSE